MTETVHFGGQDVPVDAEVVTAVNEPILTLEPLRHITTLRELRVVHTDPHTQPAHWFDDLEPLRDLVRLERLELPDSRVADLSPLAGLRRLRRLDVRRTRVRDLDPLRGLPELRELDIQGAEVTDLSPLAALPALQRVDGQPRHG
ncbi:MAG TPA: leucine-rich repeat domain-containing protein [Solirubrobacter sp.]|nr:leucine-rich repeat domain-containing protein [Solirubrobacter sp.]